MHQKIKLLETKVKVKIKKIIFVKSLIRARQNVFDIISCNINNVPISMAILNYPNF